MFRQLASVETLVPPNLTTTQRDVERADIELTSSRAGATTHCYGERDLVTARLLRTYLSGLSRDDDQRALLPDGSTRLYRVWGHRAAGVPDGPLCRGSGRRRCCLPPRRGTLRLDRSFRYPVRTSFIR